MVTTEQIREILTGHRVELDALGVTSLRVFGSVARGEAGADSDVDLLVEFKQPVGLLTMARLQALLTEWLGQTVDLAEPDALRDTIRERVLAEAVRAA